MDLIREGSMNNRKLVLFWRVLYCYPNSCTSLKPHDLAAQWPRSHEENYLRLVLPSGQKKNRSAVGKNMLSLSFPLLRSKPTND